MKCQTFTHHVGTTKGTEATRVECVAHPGWHADARKVGEDSPRVTAGKVAAAHLAGKRIPRHRG